VTYLPLPDTGDPPEARTAIRAAAGEAETIGATRPALLMLPKVLPFPVGTRTDMAPSLHRDYGHHADMILTTVTILTSKYLKILACPRGVEPPIRSARVLPPCEIATEIATGRHGTEGSETEQRIDPKAGFWPKSRWYGARRNSTERGFTDSKTVVPLTGDRGFESLPLRQFRTELRTPGIADLTPAAAVSV
jgi:hypothetical protein